VGALIALGFLLARSSSLAGIIPPQPKTLILKWNYSPMSTDIVFKVYSSTNLSSPCWKWPVYTNLTTTSCVIQISPGARFFAVTASNMTTQTESAFAQ
jgi:hypothetical protein